MAAKEFPAFEAFEALDKETACRVARLVVECAASVPLALLAVQDANTSQQAVDGQKSPRLRTRLSHLRSVIATQR
jgi:hypothetical protein